MDYPAWYVAFLTSPMLIPLIAIPHVIVAQFAVGGGILLADMVRRAYRDGLAEVLEDLRGIARFFILLTIVFGAVTGLGIWWTIGLTSPETTSALIHIFVFGWAAEWVAFIVELVSAFAFYYLWDRLRPREHLIMGWIYAVSAWISLVLITGITAFMLTSGNWTPEQGFFRAFFNPSFFPQVLIRTGGSLAIAALWIGLIVSFQNFTTTSRDRIIHWISQWALGGMALMILGGVWYFMVTPEHVRLNLIRAPMLIMMTVLNFAVTLIVLSALAIGRATGSRWITPPSALLLLLAGMVAITTGEFIREGARKPYRIENYILAPGVHVANVDTFQQKGFIANSRWLQHYLEAKIPGFSSSNLDQISMDQKAIVGEAIFHYHCSSCHAQIGYNGIIPIIQPWTPELIQEAIRHLHRTNPAMPPWLGNKIEQDFLTAYLIQLNQKGR